MKLSIIIVSWNGRGDLVNCLRSIEENPARERFEVIVIDNASRDGTVETVKNTIRYRRIDAVVEELDFLVSTYGVRNIKIIDEMFSMNERRVVQLFN